MEVTRPISARQASAFSEVQHLCSTFGHHVPALHLALAPAPHSRAVRMQGRQSLLQQPPGYVLQDRSPSQGREGEQAQIPAMSGGVCRSALGAVPQAEFDSSIQDCSPVIPCSPLSPL